MDKFNNKDWFEYIKKLNDRELSSKSSNGLTLWAIMGLFSYLLFQLITYIPIIAVPENNFKIILFITNLNNLFTCCCLILYSVFDFSENKERTIINDLSSKTDGPVKFFIFVWLFFSGILNIYVGFNSVLENLYLWSYYAFGVYYIINVFLSILINKILDITIKKNGHPKIESNTTGLKKSTKSGKILINIISFAFCLALLFQIKGILNNFFIGNNDILLLKISLQTNGLVLSVFIFISKYVQNIRNSWLRNFERKIIVEDLTTAEIKKVFIEEYIGNTSLNWLKGYSDSVEERLTSFINSVKDLNEKFLDFDLTDTDTIDEALTLLELNMSTYEEISNSRDNVIEFINEKINYLILLKDQGPLTKSEQDFIIFIYKSWYKKLDSYNNFFLQEVKPKFDKSKQILSDIKIKVDYKK